MEKAINIPVTTLPIMESFYTLQGEGAHQGKAAYFIRLGGCDVGCVWCDVKESWNADAHPQISIDAIVNTALQSIPATHQPSGDNKIIVVITGGEPLLYDLELLTKALQAAGFRTHIETSGSCKMSGVWDWVCLSPKKFKAPLPEVVSLADELKIIIYNNSDFAWGEKFAALASAGCRLFLQPEWSKAATVTPLIIDYIKANPQWQLSLQVHKYINIP